MGGQNQSSSNSAALTINGGNLYVEADGDGLDSNGSITETAVQPLYAVRHLLVIQQWILTANVY